MYTRNIKLVAYFPHTIKESFGITFFIGYLVFSKYSRLLVTFLLLKLTRSKFETKVEILPLRHRLKCYIDCLINLWYLELIFFNRKPFYCYLFYFIFEIYKPSRV